MRFGFLDTYIDKRRLVNDVASGKYRMRYSVNYITDRLPEIQ